MFINKNIIAKTTLKDITALKIFKIEAQRQIKKYKPKTGRNFLNVKQIASLKATKGFKKLFVFISQARIGAINKNIKLYIVIASIKLNCQPYIMNNLSVERVLI